MKTLLQLLTSICLILFASNEILSSHIIGGQMSYQLVSYNADSTEATYAVQFTLFRDALGTGADFDRDADFGIFRTNTLGYWDFFDAVDDLDHTPVIVLDNGANTCASALGEVLIEKSSYEFNISLPISDQSYMIAYQRCCRSRSVNNLLNPRDTGAAYTITITPAAQRMGNSSPNSAQEPIFFACADQPFMSDNTSIDTDGDSLVYRFCAPLVAGGVPPLGNMSVECCECVMPNPRFGCNPPFDEVIFADTYSFNMPFGENSSVTLDPATGIITGTAGVSGIYAYSICVEEYRDGVLLGKFNREVSSLSLLQTTSTDDNIENPISLFPNPVNSLLFINIDTEYTSIDLLSIKGEVINKDIKLTDSSLDVSDLEDGIYFIRIQDNSGRLFTHKFAKIQ